jgi:hypothetical protein
VEGQVARVLYNHLGVADIELNLVIHECS